MREINCIYTAALEFLKSSFTDPDMGIKILQKNIQIHRRVLSGGLQLIRLKD